MQTAQLITALFSSYAAIDAAVLLVCTDIPMQGCHAGTANAFLTSSC